MFLHALAQREHLAVDIRFAQRRDVGRRRRGWNAQEIRQAVMKDKSLTMTAKNVKIITAYGKVTLSGPGAESGRFQTQGAKLAG